MGNRKLVGLGKEVFLSQGGKLFKRKGRTGHVLALATAVAIATVVLAVLLLELLAAAVRSIGVLLFALLRALGARVIGRLAVTARLTSTRLSSAIVAARLTSTIVTATARAIALGDFLRRRSFGLGGNVLLSRRLCSGRSGSSLSFALLGGLRGLRILFGLFLARGSPDDRSGRRGLLARGCSPQDLCRRSGNLERLGRGVLKRVENGLARLLLLRRRPSATTVHSEVAQLVDAGLVEVDLVGTVMAHARRSGSRGSLRRGGFLLGNGHGGVDNLGGRILLGLLGGNLVIFARHGSTRLVARASALDGRGLSGSDLCSGGILAHGSRIGRDLIRRSGTGGRSAFLPLGRLLLFRSIDTRRRLLLCRRLSLLDGLLRHGRILLIGRPNLYGGLFLLDRVLLYGGLNLLGRLFCHGAILLTGRLGFCGNRLLTRLLLLCRSILLVGRPLLFGGLCLGGSTARARSRLGLFPLRRRGVLTSCRNKRSGVGASLPRLNSFKLLRSSNLGRKLGTFGLLRRRSSRCGLALGSRSARHFRRTLLCTRRGVLDHACSTFFQSARKRSRPRSVRGCSMHFFSAPKGTVAMSAPIRAACVT